MGLWDVLVCFSMVVLVMDGVVLVFGMCKVSVRLACWPFPMGLRGWDEWRAGLPMGLCNKAKSVPVENTGTLFEIMQKRKNDDSMRLADALGHHGLGDLDESGYVGTLYIVDVAIWLSTILHAILMDVIHDVV